MVALLKFQTNFKVYIKVWRYLHQPYTSQRSPNYYHRTPLRTFQATEWNSSRDKDRNNSKKQMVSGRRILQEVPADST